jgi:hypothetical protein
MASFTPKEIFELEKQLGYSWQNLQPFYTLCESSVPEVYQMGAFCMEFLSWDGTPTKIFSSPEIFTCQSRRTMKKSY